MIIIFFMNSRVSILPVQKEMRKSVEKYRPNLPVLCNSLVTPVMSWRPLYCNMRSASISFSQAFRTRWLYYVTVLRIVWQTCIFCQLFSFWFCSTYSFGQTASSELEARTSDCPCHSCWSRQLVQQESFSCLWSGQQYIATVNLKVDPTFFPCRPAASGQRRIRSWDMNVFEGNFGSSEIIGNTFPDHDDLPESH